MVIILMGVAGAGKTAVGQLLARRLGWSFCDGDDLHPESNIRKMSAGRPLTDEDRQPWLESIRALISAHEMTETPAVIACSALKQTYRGTLLADTRDTRIVYLRGTPAVIRERLRNRRGHFFDPGLLGTQFAALEEPTGAVTVDIDAELEAIVAAIVTALDLEASSSEEEGQQ